MASRFDFSDSSYDRERDLDRRYEREGGYTSRRPIPLHEDGAVRVKHEPTCHIAARDSAEAFALLIPGGIQDSFDGVHVLLLGTCTSCGSTLSRRVPAGSDEARGHARRTP